MRRHRDRLRWTGIPLIIAMAACGAPRDVIEAAVPSDCNVSRDEAELFVGTVQCLEALPQEEISGFWVVDHEYSVLYPQKTQIKRGFDGAATWVELSTDVADQVRARLQGKRQVFQVRFIGAKGTSPGLYGNGTFSSGVLMRRVLVLTELPSN